MNVREIIDKYLRENGYDGLCGDECCCDLNDLMSCGEVYPDCSAGYKVACGGCEHGWCMSTKKLSECVNKE